MVSLASLWLPIIGSAVAVFIVSSIVHMALTYHNTDFDILPNEDGAMATLRGMNLPPGDYMFPCSHEGMAAMKDPAFKAKLDAGPRGLLRVFSGTPSMGKPLALWFLYSVVVSVLAAYVASRALAGNAAPDYLEVFRFAGVTAFAAYTLGQWQESIWYQRKWSTTLKNTFDGLLYGLVTAGVFGWLWPR